MTARRFLGLWLAGLAVLLAAVAAFNAAVDPYLVFGTPRIPGFNARKPGALTHQTMTKTYLLERARPVTVLLGSSRVDVGLAADSPAFPAGMRPVFNFGIDGSTTQAALFGLAQAAAGGRLAQAVLVLDPEQAFKPPPPTGPEMWQRGRVLPDLRPNAGRRAQRFSDVFLASLTLDALLDSVATVAGQHDHGAPDVGADGATGEAELAAHAEADGYGALFADKHRAYEIQTAAAAAYLRANPAQTPSLEALPQILAFCRDHAIRATLVIPPVQDDMRSLWHAHGLEQPFLAWKAAVIDLVGRFPGEHIWDFSQPGAYTSETPPPGDRHLVVVWFWESMHFKRALGEVMLQRMFGTSQTGWGEVPRRQASERLGGQGPPRPRLH